ncbi:CD8A protein, partial [Nicator chloris]|nr:CD8A protein [Nicator chloris]
MDTAPALLLLLTLGFCEYGHGVRSPKDISQLQVGQKLELECQTDKHTDVFWIHQDTNGTLHFIVFMSSTSRATFVGNQRTSTHFEARKEGTFYHLVVKSFTPHDEGNYFCITNFSQMLYFSPGQPVFLPGQQHLHPALPKCPAPPASPGEPSLFSIPADSGMKEDLDYFCLIFLWVPLAGLCLLLLQLLATTIVLRRLKAHH